MNLTRSDKSAAQIVAFEGGVVYSEKSGSVRCWIWLRTASDRVSQDRTELWNCRPPRITIRRLVWWRVAGMSISRLPTPIVRC